MIRTSCSLSAFTLLAFGLPTLSQAQGMAELPDGQGKELVEAACVACHELELISGSAGYTNEQWRHLMSKMIDLPDPLGAQIAHYLTNSFPQNDSRRPHLVSGDTEITFEEWTAPTLGQRPRDPLMTPDGMVWWAGMYGSLIGRLNPETGEMTEWKLDPMARPHSIMNDVEGNIWYSGNSNASVGMLDPDTGEITVYPMPDPAARDPHTMAFTPNGDLWFTAQNSNYIGRLVPDTGDIRLMKPPTESARPYGIKSDSNGTVWVAYRGSNAIAKIDPDSWEVTEYRTPNPNPESHNGNYYIRRLALAEDDTIWYVDSGRGYIGRMDPDTGAVKEWASPSGPKSHPYAIAVVDGIVWYNESGQRPDTLVRFDPATEQFQSWAIPSGVGIIRNMNGTPDGDLVIHQSSTNTVGLVRIHDSGSRVASTAN
jgi:virginiamycin B lyase